MMRRLLALIAAFLVGYLVGQFFAASHRVQPARVRHSYRRHNAGAVRDGADAGPEARLRMGKGEAMSNIDDLIAAYERNDAVDLAEFAGKCVSALRELQAENARLTNERNVALAERHPDWSLLERAEAERDEALAARESIEEFSHMKTDEIVRLQAECARYKDGVRGPFRSDEKITYVEG